MDANDYYLSQHMNAMSRYDDHLDNYSRVLDYPYRADVLDVKREDIVKVMDLFMHDTCFIPKAYPQILFYEDGETVGMYWEGTMDVNLSDYVDWEYEEDACDRRSPDELLHKAWEDMDRWLNEYLGYRVSFEIMEAD